VESTITTVDESSVFCEIVIPVAAHQQHVTDVALHRR
jgi:hypothetical protein